MQINWLDFTPGPALLGGLLLGVAAALYLNLHGRILGISGIISSLLNLKVGDVTWRLSMVLGLLTSPLWAAWLFGINPIQVIDADWIAIIIAGLLVGFGSAYGSGCTSGHGICGLSRLSPRSVVATLSFMLAGFITVFVIRHMIGA
jgi:uncharacterized membrane protein YedE/YeeE